MKARAPSVFTVRHAATTRASFGPYEYDVLRDGEVIARYWHDYRGDEHGIRFVDGAPFDGPVGRMTDFLQGGGREPLTLSPAAIAWLAKRGP